MSPPPSRVGLTALVVDDERPALDELAWLLSRDDRVGQVLTAGNAAEALVALAAHHVDCVFLDVQMPGRSGLELGEALARAVPGPLMVFVTAHEAHAVEAFDLNALDYVLKPVRAERLAEAVRRVVEARAGEARDRREAERPPSAGAEAQIPVELGGVTRFVDRAEVTHVEAQGDYARLFTASGSHLLRVPLSTLEVEWGGAGFVRVHRSLLVSLAHVTQLRMEAGRCTVLVGAGDPVELGVSRRHTRALRELLARRAAGETLVRPR